MKSAVLPAFLLLVLAACDDAKDAAAARMKGMPDTCCLGSPEDLDRTQIAAKPYLKPGAKRTFSVTLTARVAEPAKRVRLWFPVPQESTVQAVRNLAYSREPKVGTEPKYGNKIASWEVQSPSAAVEVSMTFECTRWELLTDLAQLQVDGRDDASAFEVFRKADRLAVLDSETGKLSDQACQGKTGALEKARAIYDFVLSTVAYDPAASGGGSTTQAREKRKGDSADLHSYFNSLARAQGIASGLEAGLLESAPGAVRTWAFFRVPGKTWVPVDAVAKARGFGELTADRVTLSTGRDLMLVPEQEGPALNVFGAPYAEADGKPVPAVMTWSFKSVE